MWAAYGFSADQFAAAMGATPPTPDEPGSGRERSYICRACAVQGSGLDDGSLTCWCCDSDEHIDLDKRVIVLNAHNWVPHEADTLEAIGSLVG